MPVKMIREIMAYKHIGAAKSSNSIYTTVEEYVDDGRTFNSVTFQNYALLFRSYFLAGLFLLLLAKRRWPLQLLLALIESIWSASRQWKLPYNRRTQVAPSTSLQSSDSGDQSRMRSNTIKSSKNSRTNRI